MHNDFAQRKGIDFNEIFSPIVKFTSVRTLLCLATQFDLLIKWIDVKTFFLHGDLDEKIYIMQPEAFANFLNENLVCCWKTPYMDLSKPLSDDTKDLIFLWLILGLKHMIRLIKYTLNWKDFKSNLYVAICWWYTHCL